MRSRRDIDRIILDLAARSRSVVDARELRARAIGRDAVKRRMDDGWMNDELPRTYVVGPECREPNFDTRCVAAVRHAGPTALLDGETAATVLDVWDRGDDVVHVVAPGLMSDRSHDGYVFHRAPKMWTPISSMIVDDHPLVGFLDMCIRLAGRLTPWQLAFVMQRGLHRRLVTVAALAWLLGTQAGIPHIAVLREAVVLVIANSNGTRSRTEDRLLPALLSRLGPPSSVNVRGALGFARDEPDFVWNEPRVNVEVDGSHHLDPAQAADDRDRDAQANARGWPVVRIAYPYVWSCLGRVVEHVVDVCAGRVVRLDRFAWSAASPEMRAAYSRMRGSSWH